MSCLYRVKWVQIAIVVWSVEAPSCANSMRDIERCLSYIIATQFVESIRNVYETEIYKGFLHRLVPIRIVASHILGVVPEKTGTNVHIVVYS